MCGRFTQFYTWAEIRAAMDLTGVPRNLRPRYNIAPTTMVDVVRVGPAGRELVPMRWGLVPGWWKKSLKDLPSTFNARAETVAEKPLFRSAFKRSRCIVGSSGYFEWATIEGEKQPYFISAADGAILGIAGLWDQWKNAETGEMVLSCTLIVTEANETTRGIHDRMPVLLDPGDYTAWLKGDSGAELLRAAPNDLLQIWSVSKKVNYSGRGDDDPSLIEPIDQETAAPR